MNFKVGDKVGLNFSIQQENLHFPWIPTYDEYEGNYFPAVLGTVVSVHNDLCKVKLEHVLNRDSTLIEYDSGYNYSWYETIEWLSDDLVSYNNDNEIEVEDNENHLTLNKKYLVSSDDFANIVKNAWLEYSELAKKLETSFNSLRSEFNKLNGLAKEKGYLLKDFDTADCLKDFIDQAGWSASSIDCPT